MTAVLGIIADDFTGALMVAGYLESAGIRTAVIFDPKAATAGQDAAVLILATRTRLKPVAEAMAEVQAGAEALEAAGCTRIAYKACASFDSTEDGNIGPAADLLSDRRGGAGVLMSAGYPAFNATVHQGYLFYRGRLVSDSIKRHDPLTPMSDPDLVRFLSRQTRSPVALLPHRVLLQGEVAARAAFAELVAGGSRHVLADTSDDGDVAVSTAVALSEDAVVVASDPLILGYAKALAGQSPKISAAALRHADGPAAVIAGSVGPVVLAQLAVFAVQHLVLTLDLLDPRPAADQIAAALAWAAPLIGAQPFAISTATDPAGVDRAQAVLGAAGAAQRAEHLLGGIAKGLVVQGVRRLVVAGGETSGAVVTALGITRVRVFPEGPLGTGFCVTETAPKLSLYLKPGKLGADDILLRAITAMQP
ncbi:four-carbon acid sugar kinase family protein [Cypionkella sp. TWP1-2-1b2]|uniref:four-carbon acid sugar kinase family protein n=1 Tax=Cypionkella sp. TWP1-2-1b2 TaxID=2804675 RepID=UPI003CF5D53D